MLVFPVHAFFFLLSTALPVGAGALLVLVGIGLFKLRNWARVTLIVLIGLLVLNVACALAVRALHAVSLGWLLIAILITAGVVIYLFQPQVKRAFGATGL